MKKAFRTRDILLPALNFDQAFRRIRSNNVLTSRLRIFSIRLIETDRRDVRHCGTPSVDVGNHLGKFPVLQVMTDASSNEERRLPEIEVSLNLSPSADRGVIRCRMNLSA